MFAKFVALAAFVAAASAQADKYPAGVDPRACPNFPICDNAVLHTGRSHPEPQPQYNQYNQAPQFQYNPAPQYNSAPQYNPAPQYNQAPQYNPAPVQYNAAPSPAAQYPAGVNPATCPNYPYCSTHGAPAAVAPLPGFTSRLYPAGVSPNSCPNYPEC